VVKRRGQKPKSIPMKIGNEPALWRFASLQEALEANIDLIARLIRAGEEQSKTGKSSDKSPEPVPISESM
jgi:hypothetical protein